MELNPTSNPRNALLTRFGQVKVPGAYILAGMFVNPTFAIRGVDRM
jgi:hypothetical protein